MWAVHPPVCRCAALRPTHAVLPWRAGSVKYVWPIQQPISDFGVQKQRVVQVREQLGWKLVGCELLECYAE